MSDLNCTDPAAKRCATCKWWAWEGDRKWAADHSHVIAGCHHRAPHYEPISKSPNAQWPLTSGPDFCGDWEQFVEVTTEET